MPFAVTFLAVGLFALMDALMKGASIAAGAYSALLLRNAVSVSLITPVWLATRKGWPDAAAMRVHVMRGFVAAGMAFTFFWGLVRVPLAEGIALSFIAPLIAIYLAALLLGEAVKPGAVGASLLGLAGVAVIALGRMGTGGGHPEVLWGVGSILVSSMLYAWNLVLQRQQAQLARPIEVATLQTGMVGLVLLLFAPWLFEMPARETWPEIAGSALLSLAAGVLLAWAYARAETQALVPLEYSSFLWAALFGWLIFEERVSWTVVLGAALIVAACWIAAPRGRPEQTAT